MKNLVNLLPRWVWLLVVLCLGAARPSWAQLPSTAVADPDLTRPLTDTARIAPKLTKKQKREQAAADSVLKTERLFGLRVTRPKKALLLAAIAPGAGQIYNKRWWKVPLVFGLLGTLGGVEYFYQVRYSAYRDAKANLALNTINPTKYPNYVLGNSSLGLASVERSTSGIESGLIFYRRNRDLYVLVFIAGYGLQMLDAVVDANLHDFDVSKDLSLHWEPALLPVPGQVVPGVGATVALRVK